MSVKKMDVNTIDPAEIICDPNIMMRPTLFLLLFTSCATIFPKPSDANPEDILSQFKVEAIFHKKQHTPPEHEFLLIQMKNPSGRIKHFILDRTVSTTRKADTDTDTDTDTAAPEPEVHSHKVIERIKKFIHALLSVAASNSNIHLQVSLTDSKNR
jgi:hypothetical protein